MRATAAICTHNRAGVFERAVERALREAQACDAEVLVVDNASTDATPAVLARLQHETPALRLVREPRLGLSAARNRALAEARGEVVAFLDDDAVPRPGWLAAHLAPYDTPEVISVGGRIRLAFSAPPPAWLAPSLHCAFGAFDLGDAPRRVRYRPGDEYPYGGNISFRRTTAQAFGGFSTRMGLRGSVQLQHEETDLCYRIDHAGGEIRYAPAAVVDHAVLAERLTPAWLIARHWHRGQSDALFQLTNRGLRHALGRVRWYYGAHLAVLPYVPREPIDGARLVGECRRREALGYLVGLGRGFLRLGALRASSPRPPLAAAALSNR